MHHSVAVYTFHQASLFIKRALQCFTLCAINRSFKIIMLTRQSWNDTSCAVRISFVCVCVCKCPPLFSAYSTTSCLVNKKTHHGSYATNVCVTYIQVTTDVRVRYTSNACVACLYATNVYVMYATNVCVMYATNIWVTYAVMFSLSQKEEEEEMTTLI